MKTIIIHHLQECWEFGLRDKGTSFFEMLENVMEHLSLHEYNKIIVTNFASWELEDGQYPLAEYHPIVYNYDYGWHWEMIEDCPQQFISGGAHSECVLVDDWMYELVGEIHICGAFDGECIEDLEIALSGAGKQYKRLNSLIV